MKICQTCGILTNQYYNKQNTCKDCIKKRSEKWRLDNPIKFNNSQKKYKLAHPKTFNPIRQSEYYKKWYRLNKRKRSDTYIDEIKMWQKMNPEKIKAHHIVSVAIRNNKLTKPLRCEKCGSDNKLLAHHSDYRKPLDVVWLCYSCHKKHHTLLNNLAIDK